MTANIRRGSIAWADVIDPYTGQPSRRLVVVVTATRDIQPGAKVTGVGVSTDIAGTQAEIAVLLPWSPDGSARTGLYEPCVAVCNWLEEVPVAGLDEPCGSVPPAILKEILAKIDPPPAG